MTAEQASTKEVHKKGWTEEERLELATKLDAELDEFINGLEKKRYTEGWPEDRWQEEMEKHPFFMKKAPQPGDEVHPMLEGLQKLKYDPEETTEEELALNYKDDGNFYMKHRKFRLAIYSFTEGIKANCRKAEVQAVLYNNRSAANYLLQNYRSSLNDAERALQYKPDYVKACRRAALCAAHLNKFDLCTRLCEQILEKDFNNVEAQTLLRQNKIKKQEFERNARRAAAVTKKAKAQFQRLCSALRVRRIKFDEVVLDDDVGAISANLLRPKFLPIENSPVHLDEDDGETLIWPATFTYPEFSFTDFMLRLSENTIMEVCLNQMLETLTNYDNKNIYRPGNVSVYYENCKTGKMRKVDLQSTIKDIVSEDDFFVAGGALLFYILPTGSQQESDFLSQRSSMLYT